MSEACLRLSGKKAAEVFQMIEDNRLHRAEILPTESEALRVMMCAYERLKELGWREPRYMPTDGSAFQAVELGSTGVHEATRDDAGRCWIFDGGDTWPSTPFMFKPLAKAS